MQFVKTLFPLIMLLLLSTTLSAQTDLQYKWHLLDNQADQYWGISLEKAKLLLKTQKRTAKPIVVAVLDSGIDTTHEDLKKMIWHNNKEIPNNGIDDDKNGYVDDFFGWNFLGGKQGENLVKASDEKSRVYHQYKNKYLNIDSTQLASEELIQFRVWQKAAAGINYSADEQMNLIYVDVTAKAIKRHDKILREALGKDVFSGDEIENFFPQTKMSKDAKLGFLTCIKMLGIESEETNIHLIEDLDEYIEGKKSAFAAKENPPIDNRALIVKDDYYNFSDQFYGNNDVMGKISSSKHGTHVSGIIGAESNNGVGMDGVAENVKIMMIRVVPDGDEYDKDVALGIRYAVNNGAKVINLSFGKSFSPQKNWVDSAIRFAEMNDVLIIHAAGNDGEDIDKESNFPNPWINNQAIQASNFITVGASSDRKFGKSIAADFSNFGKQAVDVFAPGVKIYSTFPGGNQYGNLKGTSMAAPIVSGMAAVLRGYYPNFTAQQIKLIIENSSVKPDSLIACYKPGAQNEPIAFEALSKTGGIVNLYQAVLLAEEMNRNLPNKKINVEKTISKN